MGSVGSGLGGAGEPSTSSVLPSRDHRAVDPQPARPERRIGIGEPEPVQYPGGRQPALGRILGVEPDLDRVPDHRRGLAER